MFFVSQNVSLLVLGVNLSQFDSSDHISIFTINFRLVVYKFLVLNSVHATKISAKFESANHMAFNWNIKFGRNGYGQSDNQRFEVHVHIHVYVTKIVSVSENQLECSNMTDIGHCLTDLTTQFCIEWEKNS